MSAGAVRKVIAGIVLTMAAQGASAQSYPSKPVSVIIPNAAGGPADVYGRILFQPMSRLLGQPIVVENIGGAGGNIGIARAAKAAPDGHTLLYQNMGMATNPALYRKLDYNPLADFEYIGVVTHSVLVLVARRDFAASDARQLAGLAREAGDRITLANAGIGGPSGLCSLLLQSALRTRFTTVTYKGTAPALNDVMGGQVDMICDSTSTAGRHITAGKVKALGLTSRTRLPALPGVATLDEQGLAGFELLPWTALYAPKGTPRPVVERLATALRAALADPGLIAQYEKLSLLPASPALASPAGLQAHIKAEADKWGELIRKAGVPPQ